MALIRRPFVLVLAAVAAVGCGKRKQSLPPPVDLGSEIPAGTFHAGRHSWQREVPVEPLPWVLADAYCRKLPLAGGGWRLPERDELHTLARMADENESLANVEGLGGLTWSATKVAGNPEATWLVDVVTNGQLQSFPSDPHRVRCVRMIPGEAQPAKPPPLPEADLASNGITFVAVGHEWRQVPPEQALTFEEARRHCSSLGSAEGSTWRLPTWAETLALYEAKEKSPKLAALPGMYAAYWTSDVTLCEGDDAGTDKVCAITSVNFHDGSHYLKGPASKNHVRCVR